MTGPVRGFLRVGSAFRDLSLLDCAACDAVGWYQITPPGKPPRPRWYRCCACKATGKRAAAGPSTKCPPEGVPRVGFVDKFIWS